MLQPARLILFSLGYTFLSFFSFSVHVASSEMEVVHGMEMPSSRGTHNSGRTWTWRTNKRRGSTNQISDRCSNSTQGTTFSMETSTNSDSSVPFQAKPGLLSAPSLSLALSLSLSLSCFCPLPRSAGEMACVKMLPPDTRWEKRDGSGWPVSRL